MGIRKIQTTRKLEEIIKSYLFRGRYPTFQTITYHFQQWLREHTPGAPAFNPMKVFRKETSDHEKYNAHVKAIDQDINDAYQATIEQTTQVMADFSYVETERGKLIHELGKISKNIDELILMSSNADYKYFEGQVISFEDAADINKQATTAFVNVVNKELTLAEHSGQTNQVHVNYKKAYFQTLQASTKNSALESLQHAFDDNINTAWWHVVKTKELPANSTMKAELVVMFDELEEINYIEYMPHHSKTINMKLEYTNDGSSFTPFNQQAQTDAITGFTVWNFPKVSAKGIKFIFSKSEHDERSADYYQYYFGAKSIKILKKNYLSQGIAYTNPIQFSKNIQTLSMWSSHDVPFNTELRYEIALHDPGKNVDELIWHPISSFDEEKPSYAKTVNLNTKAEQVVESNKAVATGQVINGMKVFSLVKENDNSILSQEIVDSQSGAMEENFNDIQNPRLFRGINQWKRERTYVPFNGSIPLASQWDNLYLNVPQSIRSDYFTKGNTLKLARSFGGFDDNFYRFTICVHSEEPRKEPLSLSVMSTLSSGTRVRLGAYAVYVNGERLAPSNDEVTMPFQKGWNEIQILYHWGNMQERKDTERSNLPTETIVGKFNFFKEKLVRGDISPLTHVDTHTLFHNISPNNRNYFTIHERQIVLNYLPENCVFQLLYQTNQVVDNQSQVILRAHLSREVDVPHVTPKIYTIRLRAK